MCNATYLKPTWPVWSPLVTTRIHEINRNPKQVVVYRHAETRTSEIREFSKRSKKKIQAGSITNHKIQSLRLATLSQNVLKHEYMKPKRKPLTKIILIFPKSTREYPKTTSPLYKISRSSINCNRPTSQVMFPHRSLRVKHEPVTSAAHSICKLHQVSSVQRSLSYASIQCPQLV